MDTSEFSIDPQAPFAERLNRPDVHPIQFPDDGEIPNHPRLPFLVFQRALCLSPGRQGAAEIQELFRANQWQGCWINGVFSYHHYHSTAHEVLGCFSGEARILFGGKNGREFDVTPGDVVVIPAGVGHKNLGSSRDFGVVGAYPQGQDNDMGYGRAEERPAMLKNITQVPLPAADPVYGPTGPLMHFWK